MKTPEWLARLDAAKSPEAVLSTLDAYVASWSAYDRAQLPQNCRLPRVSRAADVSRLALEIAQEMDRFDIDRTRSRLLKVLEIFVARALVRISQLEAEQLEPLPESLAQIPAFSFLRAGPHSLLSERPAERT
jgi:hypothetical protein